MHRWYAWALCSLCHCDNNELAFWHTSAAPKSESWQLQKGNAARRGLGGAWGTILCTKPIYKSTERQIHDQMPAPSSQQEKIKKTKRRPEIFFWYLERNLLWSSDSSNANMKPLQNIQKKKTLWNACLAAHSAFPLWQRIVDLSWIKHRLPLQSKGTRSHCCR